VANPTSVWYPPVRWNIPELSEVFHGEIIEVNGDFPFLMTRKGWHLWHLWHGLQHFDGP
jgi:hypothetical protein